MKYSRLYYYNFENDRRTLPELKGYLGEARYAYCENMKSKSAGLNSAYAFMLLRYALKKERGITDIPEFVINEYGKPFIKDRPDVQFNISHCKSRVVCAVADVPIGTDVQDVREVSLGAAKKFLTPHEYEHIASIEDIDTRNSELCRIWCIKESYGKMTGKGFGAGFSCIDADGLSAENIVFCGMRDGFFVSMCIQKGK